MHLARSLSCMWAPKSLQRLKSQKPSFTGSPGLSSALSGSMTDCKFHHYMFQLLSAELMYGLSVASYPGQVGQKKWPDIHHSLHVWCFLGGPHTELKLWPIQFTWCKAAVIGCWGTFGCSWRQKYMYHCFNGNSLLPLIWGDQWTSTVKIASCSCHSVMLQLTNAWLIPESKELDASSASFPQSMVAGRHL